MEVRQREIILHALGLDNGKRAYRNNFVTGQGSTDYPHCEALVTAGLMQRYDESKLFGGDYIYSVTKAGRAALKENKE